MQAKACVLGAALAAAVSAHPAGATAAVREGPPPEGAKVLYGFDFDDPRGPMWQGFRETTNTFARSAGAARAPRTLTLAWPISGCRYGLPNRVARNYDHSRLPPNRHFGFAYYVRDVKAIRVTFLNATRQELMSVVIDKPRQRAWTRVHFNMLDAAGGEPFPARAAVGDRLTQATVRAVPGGDKPVLIIDQVQVFEVPGGKAPPRRALPAAEVFNRVPIRLVLKQPAAVGAGDVVLPRFPEGKELALVWVYDAPRGADATLWLAKTLSRHGWSGTWMLRPDDPGAEKIARELHNLRMEVGALPRSAYCLNGLSYAECLDETMTARLGLAPLIYGRAAPIAFEVPDDSHRGGYQPFWVSSFGMRAVRDAGFLIENTWGKYCYLGWLKPPYPKWGGDIADCMMQLYCRRPGEGEPVSRFPGRPHEHYGWEENYTQPLNGAREIYGKVHEFGNARQSMPQQIQRLLEYVRRFDLGKTIVLKTQGIPADCRSVLEKVLKTHGRKPEFWYATLGELGTYEYLRSRCRVVPSAPGRKAPQVDLTVEMADVNPLRVRQPLTVAVRRPLEVAKVLVDGKQAAYRPGKTGGSFDVPLASLLRRPLRVETESGPTLTIPDSGGPAIMVRNYSKEPVTFQPQWLIPERWGWKVLLIWSGGSFTLKPGDWVKLACEMRTTPRSGFGVWPVVARLKLQTPSGPVYQYAAAEVTIAPRLFVKTQPWLPLFLPPRGKVKVRVYVSRDPSTEPLAYGAMKGKRLRRFLHHPALKSARGTLRVAPAEGFRITPARVDFELPQEGFGKFDFVIENTAAPPDPQKPLLFHPKIELDGIGEVAHAADPVRVYVDPKLAYRPLDERGLVLQAGFDGTAEPKTVLDPAQAGQRYGRVVHRRPGRGQDGTGAAMFVAGRKGQALGNSSAWFGTEKNFNPQTGSILFWWKLPAPARPGRFNIALVGGGLTGSWYTFWTRCERGRLEVSYVSLGPEDHRVAAVWPADERWHHVGITWDFFAKALRLYVDGKLAGEDADATKEWLTTPPQLARHLRDFPGWKDYYQGEYAGAPPGGAYSFKFGQVALSGGLRPAPHVSHMDELYVFDRALTAKEIQAHIAAGK